MSIDQVWRELEARETVFRLDFDFDMRRKFPPFSMVAYDDQKATMDQIEQRVKSGEMDAESAIEEVTELMEDYYGKKYPLR